VSADKHDPHDADPPGCGILLHQRPMLQRVIDLSDPIGLLFFTSWLAAEDDEPDDEQLREATVEVDGQNLLFLKAIVDGRPEIINVELPAGEYLTVGRLRSADRTICVHETDDPASGFHLRQVQDVRVLAPIRGWRLRGKAEREAGPKAAASEAPNAQR
jgi:hypothetical protein